MVLPADQALATDRLYLVRYSGRPKRELEICGVSEYLELPEGPGPLWPLLAAAQSLPASRLLTLFVFRWPGWRLFVLTAPSRDDFAEGPDLIQLVFGRHETGREARGGLVQHLVHRKPQWIIGQRRNVSSSRGTQEIHDFG